MSLDGFEKERSCGDPKYSGLCLTREKLEETGGGSQRGWRRGIRTQGSIDLEVLRGRSSSTSLKIKYVGCISVSIT